MLAKHQLGPGVSAWRRFRLAALLLALTTLTAPSIAQDSTRPVSWVVGFPPGGISDLSTRFVAKVFAEKLGQPVVVDNKPGAGGIIGGELVAQAKPDGQTIFYGSSGPFGAFKSLYKKLPFDPLTSFTYIHGFGSSPLILVVPSGSPFKTLKDLVDYGRANPGKLTYGSVGPGTGAHLVAELLSSAAGISMIHVPYKGSAPAMLDLLGGRLDLIFDYSVVVKPQIDTGKLRPLASSGAKRLTSHPDVATLIELGYPNVEFTAWAMIVGPAAMPQSVVDRLASAFNEALKDPSVVKYHDDQGVALMPDVQGARLREFVVREQEKMKMLIERAGVPAQ